MSEKLQILMPNFVSNATKNFLKMRILIGVAIFINMTTVKSIIFGGVVES